MIARRWRWAQSPRGGTSQGGCGSGSMHSFCSAPGPLQRNSLKPRIARARKLRSLARNRCGRGTGLRPAGRIMLLYLFNASSI